MGEVTKPSVPKTSSGSVYLQRFAVDFEYPVHFTERLFAPDNAILRDTITRLEDNRRHRCIAFVDDGLCAVRPGLISEIETYAKTGMVPWPTTPEELGRSVREQTAFWGEAVRGTGFKPIE